MRSGRNLGSKKVTPSQPSNDLRVDCEQKRVGELISASPAYSLLKEEKPSQNFRGIGLGKGKKKPKHSGRNSEEVIWDRAERYIREESKEAEGNAVSEPLRKKGNNELPSQLMKAAKSIHP